MNVSRLISGIICIGISLFFFLGLKIIEGSLIGIPFLIVGIVILLNKNEDKIEEIKYKGGKNGKNKK